MYEFYKSPLPTGIHGVSVHVAGPTYNGCMSSRICKMYLLCYMMDVCIKKIREYMKSAKTSRKVFKRNEEAPKRIKIKSMQNK